MDNAPSPTVDLATSAITPSRAALWTGRVLTGLIAAFLLFDAIGKLVPVAPVVEATQKLGFAPGTIRPIGALLAVSTVLHLVPRTQFVGAVLLTAYLGGATATHVHTGTPFWFSVAMGVLLWIAYVLRQPLVRAVL
ncbi:MAG: DoxX family protein [Myxococcales bacterium]|nr:DoxX family protein [Myxococcales bacterium]